MLTRLFKVLGVVLVSGVVLLVVAALSLPFLVSPETVQPQGSARAAATPGSRFLSIPFPGTPGLEVHYLERAGTGDGAHSFLLLHGFTFNSFTWGAVMDPLAGFGRTVAYDQLPYGLSAKPIPGDWSGANPYAKESTIAQAGAVIEALDLRNLIVAGNSSGGTLAMETALAFPERVRGLILVAPWVYAERPTFPEAVAESMPMKRLSLFLARRLGDPTLLGYSYQDPTRVTPARREEALLHTRVANWDLAWGALLDRSLMSSVDIGKRLAEVRVPVLLITSDEDKLVKPEDTRRVAEALPHATLKVLPGCGHVPQEECPGAFMEAVTQWLGTAFAPTHRPGSTAAPAAGP